MRHSGMAGLNPVRRAVINASAFRIGVPAILLLGTLTLGRSIFDDDFKPAPENRPKPTVPDEPPPEMKPAPPRLPQAKPENDNPPHVATPSLTPADPVAAPKIVIRPRAGVPSAAAVATAEKLVRSVFKEEFANHTPAGQPPLAHALLAEARHGSNDPITLYVLLRDGRDAATAAGDVALAIESVRGIRDAFTITPAEAREAERVAVSAAVRGMAGQALSPQEHRASARAAMVSAEEMLVQDDFDNAAQIAVLAEQASHRCTDIYLTDRIRQRSNEIQSLAAEYKGMKDSFAALAVNPNDPAACTAVGNFHAFILGHPQTGLPLLTKGSDTAVKELAAKDLAASSATPTTATELGRAWAAAAKNVASKPIREGMERRGAFWLDAASGAEGLEGMAAAKQAMDLRANSLKHGLRGEYFFSDRFESKLFSRIDPKIEFAWGGQPPEDGTLGENFCARWTGYIKAPAPGEYRLFSIHDDYARIWIDGQLIVDKWREGGGFRDETPVHFTGLLQQLKIEYAQGRGDSSMGLGWKIPRSNRVFAVPAEAFFHDPADPIPFICLPRAQAEGQIVLTAPLAQIRNPDGICYINDGDVERFGGWRSMSTRLSWDFVAPAGRYAVELNYACDDGTSDSTINVIVGRNSLPYTIAGTGGWKNYTSFQLGEITLAGGGQTLTINTSKKPHDSVMDFVSITLKPARNAMAAPGRPAPTSP